MREDGPVTAPSGKRLPDDVNPTGRPSVRQGPGEEGRPASTKAPTIYDVASSAGVSHQTVSRYLKGFAGIRPATRERVEAAIRELEYRPNETARLLARSRPNKIAAFTHEISQVGPSRIVLGATRGAREAGYVLDIVPLDARNRPSIDDAIRSFDRPDVAGILALASTDEVLEAFRSTQFQVATRVLTETDDGGDETIGVRAVTQVIEYLFDLGHRRFVHLSGPETWAVARIRDDACRRVLARHGLALEESLRGDWSAASGFAAVNAVDRDLRGAVVVCANDQMAIGASAALVDRGLRIPQDVSVVGLDDIPEAQFQRPSLTTVRLDFERQGWESTLDLIAQIEGRDRPTFPRPAVDLVVRGSTAPPPSV